MRMLSLCSVMIVSMGCAQKGTNPPPKQPISAEQEKNDAKDDKAETCPNNDCDKPSMTQEQIAKLHRENEQCVDVCVDTSKAKSRSEEVIKAECQRSCDQKFSVEQQPVLPSVENIIEEMKEDIEQELEEKSEQDSEDKAQEKVEEK